MATIDNIVSDLRKAIESAKSGKTQAYDTVATVKRVAGNTAWVQIPGGTSETPVQLTIACQPGDTVQVRVGGGRAWLTGNQSAPPTDDTTARSAQVKAGEAQTVAEDAQMSAETAQILAQDAKTVGNEAKQIAGNTNQYFWHTETGDDTGAHITEKTREEFLADPQNGGGNTIMRSNGMAVRDGLTEIASFGGSGSQIGKTGESHLNMDYHSMKCTDNNDYIYFYVSDLRSPHTATDEFGEGFYYVDTVEYVGTGSRVGFSLPMDSRDTNYSVKVDGVEVTSGVTKRLYECVIRPAPAEGAVVTITYPVTSRAAKAYTLGMRKSNARVGAMSVAEGLDTAASGNYSHAEGRDTVAGLYCHAEGYESSATRGCSHAEGQKTVASGADSHAEGCLTTSSGARAHAEGYETQANGYCSHAQNYGTQANGDYSHAQNYGTIASKEAQTVIGRYNEEDIASDKSKQKALIIGNGTDDDNRSNAFSVDWNGNLEAAGSITDGEGDSIPHVKDITDEVLITTTVGKLNSYKMAEYGRVRMLRISVQKSSATAAGANLYQGKIENLADRPLFSSAYGCGYVGSTCVVASIAESGDIVVRVTGGSVAANSSTWLGITYIA